MIERGGELESAIAIVGIAGRFPGCGSLDEFWSRLRNGDDCLRWTTDDELDALGIPETTYQRPDFVRRSSQLPRAREFDPAFFGFTPREAALMDPQARALLEVSYLALENAGLDPFGTVDPVGVFVGANPNDYAQLLGPVDPTDSLTSWDQLISNDKDFLASRVAHRLNLRGPAVNVQTACSTSLVAVHSAIQSLLSFECDVALAGGAGINFRQGEAGYFCLLYTSPSPRDATLSRMPSSA